jgi:hypothetical protein
MGKVDSKIISEIKRYREINSYIFEQDAALPPPPPPPADPAAGGALPPPPGGALPPPPGGDPAAAGGTPPPPPAAPVDVANDPDVEKLGDKDKKEGDKKGKELEITDLVKSQKNVETKQEEYFDNLFKHLTDLESKLSDMDNIMNKLNDLESKIEKMRPKTPEEKLELRSLDSGPYNQKLSDFFEDKMDDMEKSGKNEYVLTQDDVENYSSGDIKKSFRDFGSDTPEPETFKQVR